MAAATMKQDISYRLTLMGARRTAADDRWTHTAQAKLLKLSRAAAEKLRGDSKECGGSTSAEKSRQDVQLAVGGPYRFEQAEDD